MFVECCMIAEHLQNIHGCRILKDLSTDWIYISNEEIDAFLKSWLFLEC
jgi:hypothetical protein